MNTGISRRTLLSGMTAGAGAAVLGWSSTAQAWVTDAAADGGGDTGFARVPRLDGSLQLQGAAGEFGADFGHLVQKAPRAVLSPGSVDDVARIVRFARAVGVKVAVNGQSGFGGELESHSKYGQALVEGGIAIDPKPLGGVHSIGSGIADVGAGLTWGELASAALETGQAPAVMNDYVHLSIGGTLSVGGLGGTSPTHGTQGDNVEWLQVVTGTGELVTCSRTRRSDLFDAVLAGGGQYALIVRAGVKLVAAPAMVRFLDVFIDDRAAFLRDSLALMNAGVVSDQNGYVVPKEGGGWRYRLTLGIYFTPPTVPDDNAVLSLLTPGYELVPPVEMPYSAWLFRFDPGWEQLKAAGFWGGQKPWLSVLLSAEDTPVFLDTVLAELSVTDLGAGVTRVSAMDTDVLRRPTFMLPKRATSDIFEITLVRFPAPNHPDIPALVAQNRRFYDRAVALGAKRYLIGAIPNMTAADWQRHYGSRWSTLRTVKRRYDPSNLLTPGQGIFA